MSTTSMGWRNRWPASPRAGSRSCTRRVEQAPTRCERHRHGIGADAGFAGSSATHLATKVKGPAAVTGQLFAVLTAESLADALQMRVSLAAGQSVITRGGEWVGRHWLRVSRGADQHAGVIEREHRLKTLRATVYCR